MPRILPTTLLALALLASACREGDQVTVHSLVFSGVRVVDVAALKSALSTREDVKIPIVGARLPWSRQRNYFDRGRFDLDLRRIQAFYADRGYSDAKVAKFDVAFNKARTAVDVTITVDEGAPVLMSAIVFTGFEVLPPPDLATLRRSLPLQIGQPRDRQAILSAHDVAVNLLRDRGYPYAQVATTTADEPGVRRATLVLAATPGPLAHFGTVEIVGNHSVSSGIVERQLLFKPGDLYRRSVVQDTQRRLYGLALFQFVNIELVEPERMDPAVRTRITLAEGKHQRVNAGVGYGTEEKARVDGEYRHVNFFGDARSAGLHGRWSALDRGARFDLDQPYFFAPNLALGFEAERWYTFTPAYGSVVTGAKLTLTHRAGSRQLMTASVSSEQNLSSITQDAASNPALYNDLIALGLDPTTGKQEGTLGAVGFSIQRTTTDNVLDATRGYQVGFQFEDGGRLLPGAFDYDSFTIDARQYLHLNPRLVLANRLQLGDIRAGGADPALVPFAKKYFLGGATSVRGWGRYEISPLGGSHLPIGGNTMAAFSSEARLGLSQRAGGVLFLDAGQVWTDVRSVQLNDLRYAVGAGLRYQTPVGPLRLDFGYQLTPVEGLLVNGAPQLRPWRIHFSIGQAF